MFRNTAARARQPWGRRSFFPRWCVFAAKRLRSERHKDDRDLLKLFSAEFPWSGSLWTARVGATALMRPDCWRAQSSSSVSLRQACGQL